jgi:3'-phosphoadenosine 5'-phosphosulfate sulfotransferase (PAPS reductase)/FAD synthetase
MTKPKYVLAFSGGKDSTYLLYEILQRKLPLDEIRFLDCGLEYPATYEWLDYLEKRFGVKIARYKTSKNFYDLFFKIKQSGTKKGLIKGFPPSNCGCWIQSEMKLKTKPNGKDEMVYLGITANEAHRKPEKKNMLTPLIDWGITENMIRERLAALDLTPFYYKMGFKRSGCWLCPKQPRGSLYLLWRNYPTLWRELRRLDKLSPHGFKDGLNLAELEHRFKTIPEKYAPKYCRVCGLLGTWETDGRLQFQVNFCAKHNSARNRAECPKYCRFCQVAGAEWSEKLRAFACQTCKKRNLWRVKTW